MQQAHYQCHRPTPWMQESVSMNARKCVHECKKVYPCTKALPQSGIRAWIKRGRRKRDRKDRGQEAGGKKGSPTKQNTSEEPKQGPPGTAQVNKAGRGTPNFSYPQNLTPAPHTTHKWLPGNLSKNTHGKLFHYSHGVQNGGFRSAVEVNCSNCSKALHCIGDQLPYKCDQAMKLLPKYRLWPNTSLKTKVNIVSFVVILVNGVHMYSCFLLLTSSQ